MTKVSMLTVFYIPGKAEERFAPSGDTALHANCKKEMVCDLCTRAIQRRLSGA